jgi:hypothetical protein
MKYYPRIIFIDIEVPDRKIDCLKRINSLRETMHIKDYVVIKEVNSESDLGNLNAIMRGLRGTNGIILPGDEKDKYNFINIVFTDKIDKDEVAELLNKVYESTKFEEQGNVNLYVLITNNIYDFKTKIPEGSLGKIIVQKKYEDGSLLKDVEYDKIIIDLLLSLTVIPERQQFIDHIFYRNPRNNVTIFPKLFTFPDEGYLEKIKEKLLSNFLVKIKDNNGDPTLNSDFIISDGLFQSLSIDLKEMLFFKHKPRIKIPLIAGRKKRAQFVKLFYEIYDKNRRSILSGELNKISIDRNNPVTIDNAKRIEESIYIKVKELLSQKYSFSFVKKSLEGLKKNLEKEVDRNGNWYFLQDLKIPLVDGRPFEKVYVIPYFIILIVCLGLLLLNPYYSLASLIVFFIILALIGLIYLNKLNNMINCQISKDINTIKNLIENNPDNFIISLKKYFVQRILKAITNNIILIEKTLKRYENAVESYRLSEEIKTIDVNTIKKIETIIQNSIEEIISSTVKKYNREILSNYKDPDVFIYYLLDNFSKSHYFTDIRDILFKLDKNKIESQLSVDQKFALSTEIEHNIIRIGNRKKILVSKAYKPNGVEIVESADDYILSILYLGIINE